MQNQSPPKWSDVSSIAQLLGEARSHSPANGARLRHALTGFCSMVDADMGVLLMTRRDGSDSVSYQTCVWAFRAGASHEASPDQVLAMHADDPVIRRVLRNGDDPVTGRRRNIVNDFEWSKTTGPRDQRASFGLGDSIYSISVPLANRMRRVLLFHKAAGRPDYVDQDVQLLHFLHSEASWLFELPPTSDVADRVRRLSPRVREVLDAMLDGMTEKEIAAELGLAFSTTHGYVKRLYMCLGVRSRAELMATCIPRRAEWEIPDEPQGECMVSKSSF